ncbi:MAG: hypothetical protein Q7U87_01935, partial [bacterium]|nr:hypothetical protein [bacterium]
MKRTLSAVLTMLGAFLLLAVPALAQDTSNVRSVGDYPYGVNYATAFFEVGASDYSLISSGKMLIAVNVTTPASPAKSGEILLPEVILGMAVSGTHAYVADGSAGLRVIDLSDPTSLTEVGSLNSPGPANRVAVAGSYAYVAADSGVQVVNISNPAIPVQAGNYSNFLFIGAYAVAVSGNYAYAVAPHQLRILDISDPSSIDSVGSIDLMGWGSCWGTGVALSGSYAYVS